MTYDEWKLQAPEEEPVRRCEECKYYERYKSQDWGICTYYGEKYLEAFMVKGSEIICEIYDEDDEPYDD